MSSHLANDSKSRALHAPAAAARFMHLMSLLLLGLAWLLSAGAAAAAVPEFAAPTQAEHSMPVGQGVQYLIETPGEGLTPAQAMSPEFESRWISFPRERFHLGMQHEPVWLRFGVRNDSARGAQWQLAIDTSLIKNIAFHQLDPATGRSVASHQAGMLVVPRGDLLHDPRPPFPIGLGAGERATVLLRVHSDTQIALPMVLWEEGALQAQRYNSAFVTGLLFGILGVMFFYNLSLYVFTREHSYGWYTAYLLSIILYELVVTGYGAFYVWSGSAYLRDYGYELFAGLSFSLAAMFLRSLLDLGRAQRHLNVINLAFLGFFVVCTALLAFDRSRGLTMLMGLGGMVSGAFALYTAIYLAVRGNVLARYVVIAWSALIVGTVLTLLGTFGVLDNTSWLVANSQHLGFVIETVLLSIALAERIKRERSSKLAAQHEALALARKLDQEREEKIQAQEHALALQLKANEELELRVIDRTAELKRAMENVELANVELAKLSVTDALTKVHNRRYFDETLKKELDRSARTGVPLALMMIDIDYFKKINDSVGHLAGDECLRLVAAALTSCVGRSSDLVARYGGEEFALVLPATDGEHAMAVAERVRTAVEGIQFIYRGRRIPITVSLGVKAGIAHQDTPISEFVSAADEALYAAKGAGRNRVMLAEAA